MKTTLIAIAAAFALATAACGKQAQTEYTDQPAATPAAPEAPATPAVADTSAPAVPAAPKLQADLRALWHGHVVKTREYAIAVNADMAADADKAAQDVVANAKSISAAVAGFYGAPAGDEMLRLLAGHWGAVKAMTDAEHKTDAAGVKTAMDTLIANAGEIAKFLAGANPNLPEDTVNGLLVAHGGHHAAQIKQIMAGDMMAEADTWAAMQAHMDVIADALAAAIAKQFPDKAA